MTARIALLMVAVAGLAACESTKAVSTAPATPVAVETIQQDTSPRVVRSPVVPDDEDVAVASYTPPKKRVKAAADTSYSAPDPVETEEAAAPVSKPEAAKPAKPADTADKTDKTDTPVTTADASATPPATPSDSGPAPTDTAPDTTDTAATTDATPVADGAAPKSMFSDPSSFMQAQVGGFPVWLIALVGIVVLAALIIGLGGRRKPEEVV